MKFLRSAKLLVVSMLVIGGLAACDKSSPVATTGRKIDQTADAAGKKMGEAADKVGEKLGEQGAKAGEAIQDAEITAKVKASIFAEPGLRTLQISVDTVKGGVTLTGSVDTPASRDKAKKLAAAVAGVKEVDNKLMPTSTQ